MNHNDILSYLKSNKSAKIVTAVIVLVVAIFIFEAGIIVGFHKAEFAYHWEEGYEQNFGTASGPFMHGKGAPNPHGTAGKIISVSLPTFIVAGPDENERTVQISDDTIIRDGANTVTSADLAPGKYVIALGSPNNSGIVEAGFVRIMPPPATTTAATSTGVK